MSREQEPQYNPEQKFRSKSQPTVDQLIIRLAQLCQSSPTHIESSRREARRIIDNLGKDRSPDAVIYLTLLSFRPESSQATALERSCTTYATHTLEALTPTKLFKYDRSEMMMFGILGTIGVDPEKDQFYKSHLMLSRAVNKYPNFKRLADLVLTINTTHNNKSPLTYPLTKLQRRVESRKFCKGLVESSNTPQYIGELAIDFLTNELASSLQLAIEYRFLTAEQVEQIQQASVIAQEHISDKNSRNYYYYHQGFEQACRRTVNCLNRYKRLDEIFAPRVILDEERKIIQTNDLMAVSKAIIDNKDDQTLLELALYDPITLSIASGKINPEIVKNIPQFTPLLLEAKMRNILDELIEQAPELLNSPQDLQFINQLMTIYGKQAVNFIRGYHELVQDQQIGLDKEIILEFLTQIRSISPVLIKGYLEAKKSKTEQIYLAELRYLAGKMAGGGEITEEESARPYFKDLLIHVYPNNAGYYGSYESADSCADKSKHLEQFVIQPRYEIDLLSAGEVRIKGGAMVSDNTLIRTQEPIMSIFRNAQEIDFSQEVLNQQLEQGVNGILEQLSPEVRLKTVEEKISVIAAECLYGSNGVVTTDILKAIILQYEFALRSKVDEYVRGTDDKTNLAQNHDYALLCELHSFYTDTVKETLQHIIDSSWDSTAVQEIMVTHFKIIPTELENGKKGSEIQDLLNRRRLGFNRRFLKDLSNLLKKRDEREYSRNQVVRMVHLYEVLADGLLDEQSNSQNPLTRSFYQRLKDQRGKTLQVINSFPGVNLELSSFHLTMDLQNLPAETVDSPIEVKYDSNQFKAYTLEKLMEVFENERQCLSAEIDKFESNSGQRREVLYGYITKNKESAYARMTAGVCVAADNPAAIEHASNLRSRIAERTGIYSMWDMPNFLQLVLQDTQSLRCQGVVLMHIFSEGDQKSLSVSLNPSSTYLYSVDEHALFEGLMTVLEKFALDNNIFRIVVPKDRAIRTNRMGGEFEKAIEERITTIHQPIKFNKSYWFSFEPRYRIKFADIIWINPGLS